MSAPFSAAFDAISAFIRRVLPRAEITRVGSNQLQVRNDADRITLTFSNEQLDDFEVVLEGNQPRRYSQGIESDFHHSVYVALGTEGMIPDLQISGILLNEESRDWLESVRVSETRFSAESAKALFE